MGITVCQCQTTKCVSQQASCVRQVSWMSAEQTLRNPQKNEKPPFLIHHRKGLFFIPVCIWCSKVTILAAQTQKWKCVHTQCAHGHAIQQNVNPQEAIMCVKFQGPSNKRAQRNPPKPENKNTPKSLWVQAPFLSERSDGFQNIVVKALRISQCCPMEGFSAPDARGQSIQPDLRNPQKTKKGPDKNSKT